MERAPDDPGAALLAWLTDEAPDDIENRKGARVIDQAREVAAHRQQRPQRVRLTGREDRQDTGRRHDDLATATLALLGPRPCRRDALVLRHPRQDDHHVLGLLHVGLRAAERHDLTAGAAAAGYGCARREGPRREHRRNLELQVPTKHGPRAPRRVCTSSKRPEPRTGTGRTGRRAMCVLLELHPR